MEVKKQLSVVYIKKRSTLVLQIEKQSRVVVEIKKWPTVTNNNRDQWVANRVEGQKATNNISKDQKNIP